MRHNGVPPNVLIDHDAVLHQAVLLSLESQSKQVKITGDDAFALARRLAGLFDRVSRVAMGAFSAGRGT